MCVKKKTLTGKTKKSVVHFKQARFCWDQQHPASQDTGTTQAGFARTGWMDMGCCLHCLHLAAWQIMSSQF